jgi:hypothetical protein
MPSDPPRDAQGKIIPHNHPEISDDCYVIRHINPLEVHKGRVSSGAYTESKEGGMSVDVERWILADGLPQLHYVSAAEGARRIRVGDLRADGMMVGFDPDGGHPHHGAVWNVPGSRSGRRRIHAQATLLKLAENEDPPPDAQEHNS